jgi:hypothetical protein
MSESKKRKIYNAVLIGPSSSGKTSLAKYLTQKYEGTRISLDGTTSSGRPINAIVDMGQPNKFIKEDLGITIRKLMITEALDAQSQKPPWFMEDIDNYIVRKLPLSLRPTTRIILIIPTIPNIIKNVIIRNKTATIASEERRICNVLKQLKHFVDIRHCNNKCDLEKIDLSNSYTFTNKELIDACTHDKIFYSSADKKVWEEDTNGVLERYGFKGLKSNKIQYAEMRPIRLGQDITVLNDHDFEHLTRKIEKILSVD